MKEARSGGKKQQLQGYKIMFGLPAANILMALPSLKYINFLSTVTVLNRGNFCSLEYWSFPVASPTPLWNRVQHYSQQIALTPALQGAHIQPGSSLVLSQLWTELDMVTLKTTAWFTACALKLKFILAERVCPSSLMCLRGFKWISVSNLWFLHKTLHSWWVDILIFYE